MLSALLILLLAAATYCAIYAHQNGLVYIGKTSGGLTLVHNDHHVMGEPIRVLEVEGTYQSATYLDERWAEPVFPYHLLFDHVFDAWPSGDGPSTVAVLGGGGYAVPKHFVAHHPEVARIDVIEIDPKIERLARRHFFVDRLESRWQAESSGRLVLHVADAYEWLSASSQRFDAIVNDCFLALEPEAAFMSQAGAQLVADHLSQHGVYLTNVVSSLEGSDAMTLYRTIGALQRVFDRIWVYPCSPSEPLAKDNNVVIATNDSHVFDGAWEWPADTAEES